MGGNTSKDSVVHVPATRKAKSMKSKKPIKSPSSPALSRADRPDDTLFSSKAQPLAKSTENILEEPAQPSGLLALVGNTLPPLIAPYCCWSFQ
eukprot:m.47465 g.47465  ORF g.47465 m.47465 type:complete len:93 (-) comp47564_c0_seq4:1382-1660(-)